MSGEFTYYALFVMLAISTGVVFQFFLGQIRKVKMDIAKMNKSIVKMHTEIRNNTSQTASTRDAIRKSRSNVIPFRRNRRLEGNLELEYQGAKAQTRAIFHVDDES